MKRTIVVLAAISFCAVSSVHADYGVTDKGTWPKSWPKELEPLRKQARTFEGPRLPTSTTQSPLLNGRSSSLSGRIS